MTIEKPFLKVVMVRIMAKTTTMQMRPLIYIGIQSAFFTINMNMLFLTFLS